MPYPHYSSAPAIRTPKSERRHQEKAKRNSAEFTPLVVTKRADRELTPAEQRAIEAEKRAAWKTARSVGKVLAEICIYLVNNLCFKLGMN